MRALSEATARAGIIDLPEIVEALAEPDQERFVRLFRLRRGEGRAMVPAVMRDQVQARYGSVERVERQPVLRVTNLVTLEEALFNPLRALRPVASGAISRAEHEIARTEGDDFCAPEAATTADIFGRIHGRRTVTASNIAKYDAWHGLVLFDQHDPLAFDRDSIFDAFETAQRWLAAAHECDPAAVYPFIMWNCLWKAGASIVHGHLQVALASGMPYAKIERARRLALQYRAATERDYLADLFAAHRSVGLGFELDGVQVMAHLTPVKEREIVLAAETLSAPLLDTIYRSLECYRSRLGVRAFNLALWLPPIGPVPEDWSGFPVQVRIVDRGDPEQPMSDFGATELYAASVIANDPFRLIDALEEYLR